MPVTVKPTENRAREALYSNVTTARRLLEASCNDEYKNCQRIIQSSFNAANLLDTTNSNNGFVYACLHAYNNHHHLTIRPEDVWFAILSQLGFYINGNAEGLRSIFVSHKGKKELVIEAPPKIDPTYKNNFPLKLLGAMANYMNDPDLPEWIKPDFSTTTPDDVVVACILMMGGMQQFFSYSVIICGLPSVTLLGERDDWQRMLDKIDRVAGISEQAVTFHSLLKPVLGYFVRFFDEPAGAEVVSFWNRIAHFRHMGSGLDYLSGWMTAFCFWDFKGRLLYRAPAEQAPGRYSSTTPAGCDLDGTLYHCVDTTQIPAGYMGVPVTVYGSKCRLIAGSVGIRRSSSGEPMHMTSNGRIAPGRPAGRVAPREEAPGLDSVQPVSGWWMLKLENGKEKEVEKGRKGSMVKKYGKVKKEMKVKKDLEVENELEVKRGKQDTKKPVVRWRY